MRSAAGAVHPAGRRARLVLAACFAVPALVLVASLAWLALEHGTLRLWGVIVHESGRYTLRETVFYPAHFLRELPVDLAYALFVLAAVPDVARVASPLTAARGRILAFSSLGAAAFLVGAALIVSALANGWSTVAGDLFQSRTRDDLIASGSHWHYHLLSTAWFGAAAGLAVALANRLRGAVAARASRIAQGVAWGWFIALTIIFGVSSHVFTDVRYVGHQAREILTHGSTTLLLAVGVALRAAAWLRIEAVPGRAERTSAVVIRLAAVLVIPAYLGAVALGGDVMAEGQAASGLAGMVAAHYFEHTPDYLLEVMLVLGGLGLRATRGAASTRTLDAGPTLARSASREG